MKRIFIVLMMGFLVACSAKLVGPTQADADRGAKKYPDYTLAQLKEGKMLYEDNCGSCHGLKSVASESEASWKEIVPNMVQKVNNKAGTEAINAAKEALILKYVVVMREASK